MPIPKWIKCFEMFRPNNDEDSGYADESRFTVPQQTATVFNDDTLIKALARAFSSEAVKETLQGEILKPIIDRVEKHDKKIAALVSENYHLRAELEELKQYGRRNALRVFDPTWRENEDESTDNFILTLCDELALGIKREDISRSHRVGKPVPSKPRPILVKFVGYRSRGKLYDAWKSIAKTQPYIRIYKDLTKTKMSWHTKPTNVTVKAVLTTRGCMTARYLWERMSAVVLWIWSGTPRTSVHRPVVLRYSEGWFPCKCHKQPQLVRNAPRTPTKPQSASHRQRESISRSLWWDRGTPSTAPLRE